MSETPDALTTEPLMNEEGETLPYGEALAELEEILAELDAGSADVDRLADRVKRAADLVRHCRHRLGVVRSDVDDVVGDLEPTDRGDDA
jgi:exodeoxyribonuclease VII small subunit